MTTLKRSNILQSRLQHNVRGANALSSTWASRPNAKTRNLNSKLLPGRLEATATSADLQKKATVLQQASNSSQSASAVPGTVPQLGRTVVEAAETSSSGMAVSPITKALAQSGSTEIKGIASTASSVYLAARTLAKVSQRMQKKGQQVLVVASADDAACTSLSFMLGAVSTSSLDSTSSSTSHSEDSISSRDTPRVGKDSKPANVAKALCRALVSGSSASVTAAGSEAVRNTVLAFTSARSMLQERAGMDCALTVDWVSEPKATAQGEQASSSDTSLRNVALRFTFFKRPLQIPVVDVSVFASSVSEQSSAASPSSADVSALSHLLVKVLSDRAAVDLSVRGAGQQQLVVQSVAQAAASMWKQQRSTVAMVLSGQQGDGEGGEAAGSSQQVLCVRRLALPLQPNTFLGRFRTGTNAAKFAKALRVQMHTTGYWSVAVEPPTEVPVVLAAAQEVAQHLATYRGAALTVRPELRQRRGRGQQSDAAGDGRGEPTLVLHFLELDPVVREVLGSVTPSRTFPILDLQQLNALVKATMMRNRVPGQDAPGMLAIRPCMDKESNLLVNLQRIPVTLPVKNSLLRPEKTAGSGITASAAAVNNGTSASASTPAPEESARPTKPKLITVSRLADAQELARQLVKELEGLQDDKYIVVRMGYGEPMLTATKALAMIASMLRERQGCDAAAVPRMHAAMDQEGRTFFLVEWQLYRKAVK